MEEDIIECKVEGSNISEDNNNEAGGNRDGVGLTWGKEVVDLSHHHVSQEASFKIGRSILHIIST
jgi:hypothetical protein